MARKLSLQERDNINVITDVLCRALPAAQRGFAGALASALVRVKGDQITDADLVRVTAKYEEFQSALIEVIKAEVLDRVPAVDAKGDGEAFVLRASVIASGEKSAEPVAADAGEAAAEPAGDGAGSAEPAAEKKPARKRRTRRKKTAEAEAAETPAETPEAEKADEAVEPALAEVDAQPGAEAGEKPKKRSVRPGCGARAAKAKAAEAAVAEAEKPTEVGVPADVAPEPATEAAATAPAPAESEETPKEAPKKRARRRRAKKPVIEEVVVTGPEAEELLAKEAAAVEAEIGEKDAPAKAAVPAAVELTEPVANEPQVDAPLAKDSDEGEKAGEASAEAVPAESAPAAEPKPAGKPYARARVRGRGNRRGLERRPRGENLSDVPYVRRGGESEAALREQIVRLDSRLWMNGWLLSHPGAFTLYERELRGIDAALQKGELPGDLTRRQLAYKMGGNEKFFEYGSDGFKLLRAMGADDLIHHRPMPKADMLYHVPRRRKSMKILVTENLDPWLDVRDLMYEDGRSLILGERIHGVVLGGGNPVVENNRLSGLLEALGADTIEVLYWGDIDRAGVSLLQRLQVLLDGKYKVTPFMPAYRLMLERAMERYPDPDQNERTTQENVEVANYDQMLEDLSDEEAAYFSAVIEKCGLVPQEILTKADL